MKVLITGGAGFIGSALVRYLIQHSDEHIINVDKLTYAANLQALAQVMGSPRHVFIKADICDRKHMDEILHTHQPDAIIHLAAESHVDRSIYGPDAFIHSNVVGTYTLLDATRTYLEKTPLARREAFRFVHVSTDEVYGDLGDSHALFTETTAYAPSSPYSATKAASDHLVHAWRRTYGLPAITTHCTNNYGPWQLPEKLIPLIISNALQNKPLSLYGNGMQVRDWMYVDDHARALHAVLKRGEVGQTYNIGAHNPQHNLHVVQTVCGLLDELHPQSRPTKPDGSVGLHQQLITFVADRPGHDVRYAIDASKIQCDLGWRPVEDFESGLRKTVAWCLEHRTA